uniref:Chlorophyll a-b binding protein, chloroplastic n=1 Tax=Chrysotila carterae TaxID=13221 RepID=A0A7S4ETU1_CHRCT
MPWFLLAFRAILAHAVVFFETIPDLSISQVPKAGLLQILAFIGFMEVMGQLNMQRADYEPGNFLGSGQWETSESWDDYQTRELNNGRLAMFASIGMLAHAALTGKGPLELIF